MVSVALARRLQQSGLVWNPAVHDRFAIPDRDLDGQVFALNDLSTELHEFGTMRAITFNGAVEWSLDWILSEDVVWLPTEAQLRHQLGDAFEKLEATDDGYRCAFSVDGGTEYADAHAAADAYATALLRLLENERSRRSA
jgi:hypothetical protein